MLQRFRKFLPHIFFLGLLTWGVYVTLAFVGADGHIVVLLKEAEWQEIASETAKLSQTWKPFVRGLQGLLPMLQLLFERLKPFAAYAVISVLFYGGYVAYTVFRKGRLYLDFRLSALHVFLLGIFSLWLITTTMFYAGFGNMQPRLIVEPTEEVYGNAGAEAVSALRENFDRLRESGCLRDDPLQRTTKGARVFYYSGWCVQKTFVLRMLPLIGMLLLLILDFLVLGKSILRLLKSPPLPRLTDFIVSLGLGAASVSAVLWFLALFGALGGGAAWPFLLMVPVAGYRYALFWLRAAIGNTWNVRAPFYSISVLLFWLLLSYVAFNFLTVVRPFPIGWDDLGRYINHPRQLSAFGTILPAIPAIQWEYVTSLGFVLFGYFSEFGAILAQQINWLAGLLAVLAVYACARMILGPGAGLFAALFYYSLPMVGHFSFADMKTENALLFYGTAGLMGILEFISDTDTGTSSPTSQTPTTPTPPLRWLFPAGILFGAAVSTKATMVLAFFAGGTFLAFALLGSFGGIGAMLLTSAVLAKVGILSPSVILQYVAGSAPAHLDAVVILLLLAAGAALILAPLFPPARRALRSPGPAALKRSCLVSAVLFAGFLALTVPWMTRNAVLQQRVSASADLLKAPNTITPWVRYSPEEITAGAPVGSRALPSDLALDPGHEMCRGTAREEELDRYWGYGSGWSHYFALPWRVVMNIDSQGYYLTTSPMLLLLPLLLLLPFFWRRPLIRFLFWSTALYLFQWMFIANGIPWYGIGMFLGFSVFAEALIARAPDGRSRIAGWTLAFVALGTVFSLRLWQFGMQQNLYEYAWGKASAGVLREMTIPDYDDIADRVLELSKNPDRPYLYRMGTFISYFIPRNLEIIVQNDNQLEFFNCLNQERDHRLTLRRLVALGIHSIVFDTNTATIEKDSEGTLHKKVQRFLDFANDPTLGIVSVVNNPGAGIAYMVLPEAVSEGEVVEEEVEGEESAVAQ